MASESTTTNDNASGEGGGVGKAKIAKNFSAKGRTIFNGAKPGQKSDEHQHKIMTLEVAHAGGDHGETL